MHPKEQEILAAIKNAELQQKEARQSVERAKRALLDAETDLIAANLLQEKLKEELRVLRNTIPRKEETPRDKEIAEFRAKMDDYKKRGLL
jgi:hypothetical protein